MLRERGISVGKMKKVSIIILIMMFFVTFTGCNLIEKTPEGQKNTVVAKVGSDKIVKGDFDKRMSFEISRYESYYGKGF